jgi:hypothetical protein
MQWTHDHGTAGHPGRDETIRKARAVTQWPGMNAWITDYVKGCATCQQNKINTHRPRIPLYRITVPEDARPFQQIAMDLITGLPQSNGKDAILTIVDHGCSRAAVFLPCNTTITGPGIAQLYLQHIYKWFGLPKRIISDRDPRITSHFGKALVQKLGISQNLSTTAHPQTDGLSERKNQWVEQYLRLVTSLEPETWANWLPLATLVHNNRQNATTKVSPSQALLGYEPDEITLLQRPSNSQNVEDRAAAMTQFRKTAITALNATAQRSPAPEAQFKLRDQVWLEGTNLRLPHQASKLAPKRYGPFQVIQEISPVAYRLELPAAWNIHNVFHASLLTPYLETTAHGPNYAKPPPDLIEGEEEYEVERITKHRYFGRTKKLQYLIKWKGYPDCDNTWEPAANLRAAEEIQAYWARTKEAHKRLRNALLQQHPPLPLSSWPSHPTAVLSTKHSALDHTSPPSSSPPFEDITTTNASTHSNPTRIPVSTPPTHTSANTGPFARRPIAAPTHNHIRYTCSHACPLHPPLLFWPIPSPLPFHPEVLSAPWPATQTWTPPRSAESSMDWPAPSRHRNTGTPLTWPTSRRNATSSTTASTAIPGNTSVRQTATWPTTAASHSSPSQWTTGSSRPSGGYASSMMAAPRDTSQRTTLPPIHTPLNSTRDLWMAPREPNPCLDGSDDSSTATDDSTTSSREAAHNYDADWGIHVDIIRYRELDDTMDWLRDELDVVSSELRAATEARAACEDRLGAANASAHFAHLNHSRELRFTDEGGPRQQQRRRRRGAYGTRGRVN